MKTTKTKEKITTNFVGDMHARVPVDYLSARVVMSNGEHFEPNKKVFTNDSDDLIAVRKPHYSTINCPAYKDLIGYTFGRFLVLGLARDFKGQWVVKCSCGRYSTRHKKAILNKKNTQDRCEHCRHLAYLKKNDYWRRTGKNVDINQF